MMAHRGRKRQGSYNRLIWKEVKNGSIMWLIEFAVALEGSGMDSPPSHFASPSPHPSICPAQRYNFITLHLIVCLAGRAPLSAPAGGGRWERRKKCRIIEQSTKPHHFIFIDGQLVKAMGYVVPSEQSSVNTAEH